MKILQYIPIIITTFQLVILLIYIGYSFTNLQKKLFTASVVLNIILHIYIISTLSGERQSSYIMAAISAPLLGGLLIAYVIERVTLNL